MKNITVEAEGQEIILRNQNNDYVIIPKRYRREVQDMIAEGCHNCLDDLISTLPTMDDYAEDGSIIPMYNKDGRPDLSRPLNKEPLQPIGDDIYTDPDTGMMFNMDIENSLQRQANDDWKNWVQYLNQSGETPDGFYDRYPTEDDWNKYLIKYHGITPKDFQNRGEQFAMGGPIKETPLDWNEFTEFNKSLPDNLRDDSFTYGDYSKYDLYGMWEAVGKPKSFNDVKDGEDFPLQKDGTYHGFSVGNDGIWLKPKDHSTAWMEFMQGQLSSDPYFKENMVIQREDGRLQYVPRKFAYGGELTKDGLENSDNYVKNNAFNRVFRRDNILEKQIMDENKSLYNIGKVKDFKILEAEGLNKEHLEQTNRNPEYFSKGDTWYPYLDDESQPIKLPNKNKYRTLVDDDDLTTEQLKNIVGLDFTSHALHNDEEYNRYSNELNKQLISKYGQKFIDNNGGIDAYVRGLLSNSEEYAPYKKELAFLDPNFTESFKNYIKTGKKKLAYGGEISKDGVQAPIGDNIVWDETQGRFVDQDVTAMMDRQMLARKQAVDDFFRNLGETPKTFKAKYGSYQNWKDMKQNEGLTVKPKGKLMAYGGEITAEDGLVMPDGGGDPTKKPTYPAATNPPSYQDSLNLYNYYEYQRKNQSVNGQRKADLNDILPNNEVYYKPGKLYSSDAELQKDLALLRQEEKKYYKKYDDQGRMNEKEFDRYRNDLKNNKLPYQKLFDDLRTPDAKNLKAFLEINDKDWNNSEMVQKSKNVINYVNSMKFDEPIDFKLHGSPDLYHSRIKPINHYHDGIAYSPRYKKPVGTPKESLPVPEEMKTRSLDQMLSNPNIPQRELLEVPPITSEMMPDRIDKFRYGRNAKQEKRRLAGKPYHSINDKGNDVFNPSGDLHLDQEDRMGFHYGQAYLDGFSEPNIPKKEVYDEFKKKFVEKEKKRKSQQE